MTLSPARRTFFRLLLLCLLLPGVLVAAKKKTAPSAEGDYKGAIVMDAATGAVLFEDHADIVSPPASMTKLMTYAVLHDMLQAGSFRLDTPCKVTVADMRMGGTGVWLDPRETFPAEELIYAMMIQSANDAAHTLARVSAGSVSAFVRKMNEKAQELGMTHTVFRTPHGLPADNREVDEADVSTPRDYALLSRHLLQKTDVTKYTSVRHRAFGPPYRVKPVMMDNHNKLFDHIEGLDGLKTGYTKSAGFCIAASAQRDGKRAIVVVMGSTTAKGRDFRVIELMGEGFSKIPSNSPAFVGGSAPKPLIPAGTSPITRDPSTVREPSGAQASGAEPMIKLNIPPQRKSGK